MFTKELHKTHKELKINKLYLCVLCGNFVTFAVKTLIIKSIIVLSSYKILTPKIHGLLKMNFHFSKSDKVDAFAGFGVGYRNRSFLYTTTDPDFDDSKFRTPDPHIDYQFVM